MKRAQTTVMVVIIILLLVGVAKADWIEGDPYKMHWPQLPDPFGWDVMASEPYILADDFRCAETGWIQDIHFWGSWHGGYFPPLTTVYGFWISLHEDIPADPGDPFSYSMPGQVLLNKFYPIESFVVAGPFFGEQGWYDPIQGIILPVDHFEYFQYNLYLPEEDWVHQTEGNIYWLNISAVVEDPFSFPWGWKTTLPDLRFLDTSVWTDQFMYPGFWLPIYDPLFGEPEHLDLAFVITGAPDIPPPELDFGDAPEGALAYPSTGVLGSFPTCVTIGPLTWIQHNNFGAYFGPTFDFEPDGNAGLCPAFAPYDADECFQDADAGLLFPQAYTIDPTPSVVACPPGLVSAPSLGNTCQTANWGVDLDIDLTNTMPNQTIGYVNVLMDWNQDGLWGGSSPCPPTGTPAPEHVLVNFPIPNPFSGPLSVLAPPSFLVGPNNGYVWTRFSITETPVMLPWDGSGSFEDGETEDYLLHIDTDTPPVDTDQDGIYDINDNCPLHPNGPLLGTCTKGTYGALCTSPGPNVPECGTGGFCSMNQEDTYPPPSGNNCGDACECEGNFDDDTDQDGSDAANFKSDFGRSIFLNPCTNALPCNGDFDCDGDVDGTDAALFKSDFGRSGFLNPCPICPTHPWCTYP